MIVSVTLVMCLLATYAEPQSTRSELFDEKLSSATCLFSGLEGIKNYFRNSSSPMARGILETFERDCLYMAEPELPPDGSRKPFIVIEGNQKNSREVVGVRLASMLDGRYIVHPAPCLIKFLDAIPKNTLIRRAYYVLSLYATSFNVKVHLSMGRAVVLNGYWLDQLVFSLVQSLVGLDLPASDSHVFNAPDGLLMPDRIFYLNLPDDLFLYQPTTRDPDNWKRRALSLYTSLQSRHPVVVEDLKGVFRITADSIYQHIFENLSSTRYIAPRRPNVNFDYGRY